MTVVAELVERNFVCRTESLDSGHTLIGDEPEKLQGQNKGFNPFALMQSSLAN